jgi:hypothetical protein
MHFVGEWSSSTRQMGSSWHWWEKGPLGERRTWVFGLGFGHDENADVIATGDIVNGHDDDGVVRQLVMMH